MRHTKLPFVLCNTKDLEFLHHINQAENARNQLRGNGGNRSSGNTHMQIDDADQIQRNINC